MISKTFHERNKTCFTGIDISQRDVSVVLAVPSVSVLQDLDVVSASRNPDDRVVAVLGPVVDAALFPAS